MFTDPFEWPVRYGNFTALLDLLLGVQIFLAHVLTWQQQKS